MKKNSGKRKSLKRKHRIQNVILFTEITLFVTAMTILDGIVSGEFNSIVGLIIFIIISVFTGYFHGKFFPKGK